jgi:hypothetical protein
MTEEAYKALDMLNAFASVGVHRFDVTFTDLDGEKLEKGGFLGNRHINFLRHAIGPILRQAAAHQHNVIVRPRASERAQLVQLDDLNADQARRFEHRAFMTLCTSPGNFQAWVAIDHSGDANDKADFARRLKKGAGADPDASGATRISGSWNFKRKYGPGPDTVIPIGGRFYPIVEITGSNTGLVQTRAELQQAGLVAAKEPPAPLPNRVSRTYTGQKKRPSYSKALEGAPESKSRPGNPRESIADYRFCMAAIDWGWSIEDTAAMLMEESSKAQENGEHYALTTAHRAALTVAARKQPRSNAR